MQQRPGGDRGEPPALIDLLSETQRAITQETCARRVCLAFDGSLVSVALPETGARYKENTTAVSVNEQVSL